MNMNEQSTLSSQKSLVIDGLLDLDEYKVYWFDYFKSSLPNTIIFWGLFAVGSVFVAYLFKSTQFGASFFVILASMLILIPALMYFFNYREYIKAISRYISELPENERHYSLIFTLDGDGFDCIYGKDFSHISWLSLKSAVEKKDFFSLLFRSQPLIISKKNFKNVANLQEFRTLLAAKLGNKATLLPD